MPRMTNAKTAPVLDSADDFERKLNWQLFVAEQEALLAYQDPDEADAVWNVGDPLMQWYWQHGDEETYIFENEGVFEVASSIGWSTNARRPLFTLYDDMEEGLHGITQRIRCRFCYTDWIGDEPCFVCGEFVEDEWERPAHNKYPVLSFELSFDMSSETVESMVWAMYGMHRSFQRVGENTARAANQMAETVRGLNLDYVLYDEALVMNSYRSAALWPRLRQPNNPVAQIRDQLVTHLSEQLDIPREFLWREIPAEAVQQLIQEDNRRRYEEEAAIDIRRDRESRVVSVDPLPPPLGFTVAEASRSEDGITTIHRLERMREFGTFFSGDINIIQGPFPGLDIQMSMYSAGTHDRRAVCDTFVTPEQPVSRPIRYVRAGDTTRSYPNSRPEWARRRPRRS